MTDRIFLLPAVGEGNSIGLSSPFGLAFLGFFSAEPVDEPADETKYEVRQTEAAEPEAAAPAVARQRPELVNLWTGSST